MKTTLLQLLPAFGFSLAAAMTLFPLFIRLSPVLGLVDIPNDRKLHKKPIPAIGGFVIGLCLLFTALCSSLMRDFIGEHKTMTLVLFVLIITGLLDDRFDLPVKLRLFIELASATAIAYAGIRIPSLHGFLGIYELPIVAQYLLTIVIITGVTNAFNLMDGIDGLVGTTSLINVLVLIIISLVTGNTAWLFFLLPLAIGLLVFLGYNWRPAKIFMGDSGSLMLGFVITVSGIYFIRTATFNLPAYSALFTVLVTACCMIPVIDALRVFYGRMKKGRSPFSADKTHLHHLLLRHHLVHSAATKRIVKAHVILIVLSAIAIRFTSVSVVVAGQILFVILYAHVVKLMSYFQRWYRFIKKMEMAS